MSNWTQNKEKLERKRRERAKLAEVIAEKVAEKEAIEEQIARKEARDPVQDERVAKIEADLAELERKYRRLRERIGDLRSRRKRLARQIDRLVKWLRSHVRVPKVVDLKLDFRPLASRQDSDEAVGHHTAGPIDHSDAEAEALFRTYHAAHLAKGWAGEGYHLGIARSGTIFLLRPRWASGAHTYGGNHMTGIVCHGTIGDKPTKAQARSLRYILRRAGKFGVPGGSLDGRLWLHRERNATSCPGTHDRMYSTRGKDR